nr:AI-2E family transporter [Duncaniella sp.]
IIGKDMGLNQAVILISLSVWGCLLVIIGMIIALPVTSLIMAYYERYISNPQPEKPLDEIHEVETEKG